MELCNILSKIVFNIMQWPWSTIWLSIGSISTLALAYVTYKTVSEMKKSREQNIAPNLFVLSPPYKYEFRWIPMETLQAIIRPLLPKDNAQLPESRLPIFRLKNIGNGPAKNIQLEWKLDGENINNIISNSEILEKYNVLLESGLCSISTDTHGWSGRCSDHALQTIDFCIPSHVPDFTDAINIPYDIEGSYELRLMVIKRPDVMTWLTAPNINLTLTYENLDGKQHKKNFLIESNLVFLPDNVGSDSNIINKEHFNSDNIRGTISFRIK